MDDIEGMEVLKTFGDLQQLEEVCQQMGCVRIRKQLPASASRR